MNRNNTRSRIFVAAFTLFVALVSVASAQTTAPLGILVSQDQNTIDWPTVKDNNDLEFAYIMPTKSVCLSDVSTAMTATTPHKDSSTTSKPLSKVTTWTFHLWFM